MSANNTTTCPVCAKRIAHENSANFDAILHTYGTVSPAAFAEAYSQAKEVRAIPKTLREGYSMYLTAGKKLSILYSCYCTECGLSINYDHTTEVVSV